jgi:hypothetical protein
MPRDACPLGGRFSPVCMLVSAKFMADMGATARLARHPHSHEREMLTHGC